MQDFVVELMFSVGQSSRSTVEKVIRNTFILPVLEVEGEMKRGPFIWVEIPNNSLVQFLAWERAESREEAVKSINSRINRFLAVIIGSILEQVIFPDSLSINFCTEDTPNE